MRLHTYKSGTGARPNEAISGDKAFLTPVCSRAGDFVHISFPSPSYSMGAR